MSVVSVEPANENKRIDSTEKLLSTLLAEGRKSLVHDELPTVRGLQSQNDEMDIQSRTNSYAVTTKNQKSPSSRSPVSDGKINRAYTSPDIELRNLNGYDIPLDARKLEKNIQSLYKMTDGNSVQAISFPRIQMEQRPTGLIQTLGKQISSDDEREAKQNATADDKDDRIKQGEKENTISNIGADYMRVNGAIGSFKQLQKPTSMQSLPTSSKMSYTSEDAGVALVTGSDFPIDRGRHIRQKPNVGYRLGKRKQLYEKRKKISDYCLVFGMFGIAAMVLETELTMADIYKKELESLFSEHFGRTPTASQASNIVEEFDTNETELDTDLCSDTEDVDARAQRFLDSQDSEVDEDEVCADPCDDPDLLKIRDMKLSGCGCNKHCISELTEGELWSHVLNVREMDKSDKDMYIMASFADGVDKEKTKRGKKRQRLSHEFTYKGSRICKKTFMLLFDVGKHSLQSLMQHVSDNGVVARCHGNSNRKPSKSLKFEDIRQVVQFISNYADEFGIPQPAAPRGRDNTPPVYLTSETTKSSVHQQYKDSCTEIEPPSRAVKYSTFNKIWYACLRHVKIASPRDDVCATCEKLRKRVQDSVTEEEKLESANNLRDHVLAAQKEREVYNACIKRAKESYNDRDAENYIHYTFDFSQNVCLPHHSRQMGPAYFATLRKVQIFGFRIDGIPRQLNFLIDENETIGQDGKCTHGPNAVISMIHWAMETHHSGETSCTIHADNCPGQNKNKYVMGYLSWRVMTGRHQTIEYLMQIPGHGRCLVDSGFASLKKLYRRTDCDSLEQLEQVVNKSSTTNEAIRYPAWQWRDWKSFLEPVVRPVPGIRKYQYFRVTSESSGVAFVKTDRDSDEMSFRTIRAGVHFTRDELPDIIPASGLSRQRQEYLFKTVRPLVRPSHQHSLCPPVQDQ